MIYVARWNSRELFLLSVTAIGLGVGYATYLFGLSFAFGAFVAGMVVSESDHSHQALSDILPLRDLFGLLFFVSVGMLLDPAYFLGNWGTVILVVLVVSLGKGAIFAALTRLFGYGNIVPIAVGFGLFQVGEFSFVLARVGLTNNAITPELYSLVLSVAIFTMLLTPIVSGLTEPLYRLRKRLFKFEALSTVNLPAEGLDNHVIIVGYGRVGQFIANILHRLELQFVLIELDQRRMELAKEAGYPVIYGDASQQSILTTAHVQSSQLLLVTVPAVTVTRAIFANVRQLCPELHIVARAEGLDQLRMLQELGVYEVVQPEAEAGLEITRQALLHLEVNTSEIQHFMDSVRRELYMPLYREHEDYEILTNLRSAQQLMQVHWTKLPPESPLADNTIAESRIRNRTGVSVVAILRQGKLIPNPAPTQRLLPDDFLAVFGESHELDQFEELVAGPS
jgi:CPA2 family monovalent cation:H+ antiporter-2